MMSELSGIEQEQEAPTMREAAEGPLLPRWFTVGFYIIFGLFCIYGVYSVVLSLRLQHILNVAVLTIDGDVQQEAHGPQTPAGEEAVAVMKNYPVDAFLYINQASLQNEDQDPRMARAFALRKAKDWGMVMARKQVVTHILDNMADDGSLPVDFKLTDEQQQVLDKMVAQRRADKGLTYVERLITDALGWVAEGHPGKPTGAEKRRLQAFSRQFEKKTYQGSEASALEGLLQAWRAEGGTAAAAAAKFPAMLEDKFTELTPEEAKYCSEQADKWQERYRNGMVALAKASLIMIQTRDAMEPRPRLDHPHIYQYLSMLDSPFPDVRDEIAKGAWMLRHNRFTVRFLATFATKTTVNPFMAVETLRLTAAEHEREMRRANIRRMREAIALLGRIGVDYIEHPDQYDFHAIEPDSEFIRKNVVAAIYEVSHEEGVTDVAQSALAELRKADQTGKLFSGVTE